MLNIVLQTRNLSIGYTSKKSEKKLLESINLDIQKGEFIALLGKNGAGKSTLLRTLSKVQNKLAGDILINQKNLVEYSQHELAKVMSVVLTERLPESQLTVFEIVALGRQPYTNWLDKLSKEDIKKVLHALELTNVAHLKDRPFYKLSDGQLQRVLIARALAQDTEIIILDEPTAHLDIHHTYKIFSLLQELVKTTSKTIIISTHEVNLALKLADSFVLIANDDLYSGNADELIQQNAFSSLFPKELISFNKNLQQFVINKN
ncbi:ABC transporter ATP-binding protein [Tenacibaculum sp. MEBiC06402]|uniref:ABC transporter ATP-binding protein n=1 Tax=unclassified Tenacibaculum TaxID=2635139 RepID=UPI003B9B008F